MKKRMQYTPRQTQVTFYLAQVEHIIQARLRSSHSLPIPKLPLQCDPPFQSQALFNQYANKVYGIANQNNAQSPQSIRLHLSQESNFDAAEIEDNNNDEEWQLGRKLNQVNIQKGYRIQQEAHSAPIISISPYDQKLFFTSSEDHSIRLWDLRLHSSVKLFKNQMLTNLTNCDSDRKSNLFVGSGEFVYCFDVRCEHMFVEQIRKKNEEAHFDELSVIKVEPAQGIVAAGDDEGDTRLYNYDLQCVELLDQGHLNIINTVEFVKTEKDNLCLTAGYDSKIIHWEVESGKTLRQIDLQELFNKHEVKFSTPPFVYCLHFYKNTIYATTESGHVVAFPLKDPKKPKYILEASMSKVVQLRVPCFNDSLFLTLSYYDGSLSLFDHTKRHKGGPQFLQNYKCLEQPNWFEVMGTEILISHNSTAQLTFFLVK